MLDSICYSIDVILRNKLFTNWQELNSENNTKSKHYLPLRPYPMSADEIKRIDQHQFEEMLTIVCDAANLKEFFEKLVESRALERFDFRWG